MSRQRLRLFLPALFACSSPFLNQVDEREPPNDSGAACAPSSPRSLATENVDRTIVVNWDVGVVDHDGSVVERRSPGDAWVEIVELGPGAERYVDGTVLSDARYEYRVVKIRLLANQRCRSLETEPVSVLTPPGRINDFGAVLGGGGTQLTWNDRNENSTAVVLERNISGEGWQAVGVMPVSPFVDRELREGAQIEYRIFSQNPAGLGAPAFAGVVTSSGPVLSWTDFDLDPTCFVRASGAVELADQIGVQSASAAVDRTSEAPVASETGLEATLVDLSPGPFSLQWSVEDEQGFEAAISREFLITSETTTRASSRVPDPDLGLLSTSGHQPINPGCSACSGRRGHIEVGGAVACVVNSDSTASCWGENNFYTLGQGETLFVLNPRELGSDLNSDARFVANAIYPFAENTCATGGVQNALHCWGSNRDGVLGNGTSSVDNLRPSPICLATEAPECTPLTAVTQVAGTESFRCAVTDSQQVYCWGRNDGERILGTSDSEVHYATRVCLSGSDATGDCAPLVGIRKMVVHRHHQCGLKEDGRVVCWGENDRGQLGSGLTDSGSLSPREVCASGVTWAADRCGTGAENQYLNSVVDLAASFDSTCAVLQAGSVWCWGRNNGFDSYLGDGTTDDRWSPGPVCTSGVSDGTSCVGGAAVLGVERVVGSSGSSIGYCAVLSNGTAWCWGENDSGRLGSGDEDNLSVAREVCATGAYDERALGCVDDGNPSALSDIRDFQLGDRNGCAIVGGEQRALCWGTAELNGLGTGERDPNPSVRLAPAAVCSSGSGMNGDCQPLQGRTRVAVNGSRGVALAIDGTVSIWGRTRRASQGTHLGIEYLKDSWVPVTLKRPVGNAVEVATGVREVTLGGQHGCAVFDDGTIRCWGNSSQGALGTGQTEETTGVLSGVCEFGVWNGNVCAFGGAEFDPLSGVVQASAGATNNVGDGGDYACAVTNEGFVYCWGSNTFGTLGNSASGQGSPNARRVQCARVSTGCEASGAPLSGIVSVEAGSKHACAIHKTGELLCWGANDRGQLGDGTLMARDFPGVVPLAFPVSQVATAFETTCIVDTSGVARCWGDDTFGSVGRGNEDGSRNEPITLPSKVCETGSSGTCAELGGVRSISGFAWTFCALLDDGGVRCWGRSDPQLGSPHTTLSIVRPVTPCAPDPGSNSCALDYSCRSTLAADVVAVDVGDSAACVLTRAGGVMCWGESEDPIRGAGAPLADACTAMPVCVDAECESFFSEGAVRTCDVITLAEVP